MEVCAKGFNFCRVGVDIPDGVQVVQRHAHPFFQTHSFTPLTVEIVDMHTHSFKPLTVETNRADIGDYRDLQSSSLETQRASCRLSWAGGRLRTCV